ncbi:MAG: lytic transglycosylase domain-containing protein [Gemmatimonadota bacterium]
MKHAFAAMGFLSVSLVALAWTTNRPVESVSAFPEVSDATAALLETRLPMSVNAEVERWIQRFLGPERSAFEGYLVREGLYGGFIQERLRERGMPEELLYLAMIESGFVTSATSRVSASGVWQFMGATARAFGLTVDYWVDERRDPVRATDAALDYLEDLYETFGSWYLAAAAYNAGPAVVLRALDREMAVDADDEDLYWKISRYLPGETRNYVPKMLAATLIAQQPEHFGFEVERSLPYLFDRVLVPGGTSLARVARALGVHPALIRELNPHLIRGMTPPGGGHLVRVPQGDSHRLVASLDGVGVLPPARNE